MLRKEKQTQVDSLREKLGSAESIFLTNFTGINVKDISQLRGQFRAANVEYLVAKNTLIRRAVADTPLAELESYLQGPTALVIAGDDGVRAAKIITKFCEDHESFQVKAGVMSEKIIDAARVKDIARLPSREVLIARLLGAINSPIAGLVFVLGGTLARAVRALDQVRQLKEAKEKS